MDPNQTKVKVESGQQSSDQIGQEAVPSPTTSTFYFPTPQESFHFSGFDPQSLGAQIDFDFNPNQVPAQHFLGGHQSHRFKRSHVLPGPSRPQPFVPFVHGQEPMGDVAGQDEQYAPAYPYSQTGSTIPDPVSVKEHGRMFQNYRPDKYYLPNDAAEQDRLDLAHATFRLIMNGALYWAPLAQQPHRVLDIGTGTGAWAIDFAKLNEQSTVIGVDLSMIQPDPKEIGVPNLQFFRDDVEDEWVFDEPFDFIHARLMFSCFQDHKAVIKKAYDNLRPGGWIEFHDILFEIDSDDNSHRGTAFHKYMYLALAGAASHGRDMNVAKKYKDYFTDAGFVDVVETRLKLWGNPWPEEKRGKQIGAGMEVIDADAMKGSSLKLLEQGLGLAPDKVKEIIDQALVDIHNRDIHYYLPGYFVYGRKPLEGEKSSASGLQYPL